jgi:predicted dehydrogenase
MDVGIIGTGTMGRNHARIYSELRETNQVYLYDVNDKAADKISRQLDCIVCDSMDSLLKKVDAVSICVPTKYHLAVAKQVMNSDVSCLIEKPIASTSKDGQELVKLARDDLVVGVGHIERFNPIVKEIKNLISEPKYIQIIRHNPASSRITDANVAVDLMIHDIDLVWNYFFPQQRDFELYSLGDDNLFQAVASLNECLVSLSASRIASNKVRTIHVEEEAFSIEGDFMTQEVYIYRKPGVYGESNTRYAQENIIEKVLINRMEPLKEELNTFLGCVKEGKEFPVTIEQSVFNLKIAESRGLNFYSSISPEAVGVAKAESQASGIMI